MDYISMLGYIWGILVVISLLPQTIKSRKTKSTKDISLRRYIIYCTWLIIWIIYAIIIKNGPVAIMNSAGLVLAISILYLKIRYK
jgi:MtN3 and saliva related transmembrane protein